MKPLDIALQYMNIFYSGSDLKRLDDILDKSLIFEGPLYQFHTAKDYIMSLTSSPPIDCQFEIINCLEDGNLVNIIYWFSKAGIKERMSQLFEIENGKIVRIILIFDTQKFI